MGVTDVDTMLMLLIVSLDMEPADRDIVTAAMIRGFTACAAEVGTNVTGGQTVQGPWPTLGEAVCGGGARNHRGVQADVAASCVKPNYNSRSRSCGWRCRWRCVLPSRDCLGDNLRITTSPCACV